MSQFGSDNLKFCAEMSNVRLGFEAILSIRSSRRSPLLAVNRPLSATSHKLWVKKGLVFSRLYINIYNDCVYTLNYDFLDKMVQKPLEITI